MKRPRPKDQTEWYIKKQVREILTRTKWQFWMPNAGMYGRNGVSDFLAVKKPNLFMAIETKYNDVPTAPQIEFLKMIDEAGHYAFLVDETNIRTLEVILIRQREIPDPELCNFDLLMKWKVTHHDNPPTDQKHRTQTARSHADTLILSNWDDPND